MGDYNLTGLNPRDFEHLIQALLKRHVASGVSIFGDGKDGAREATYRGIMDYPSISNPWNGYLVVQCKFNKKPTYDTKKDGQWIIGQLKADLKKFLDKKRNLPKPEYYIFVTNLPLTAVAETGSKDRIVEVLKQNSAALGLKGFDVWGYDEICRSIDCCQDIRKAYAGFITTGDVLIQMMDFLSKKKSSFVRIIGNFLQKEFLYDQPARLESAGQEFERKISLANVFVDLPITDTPHEASTPKKAAPRIIARLLSQGTHRLRQGSGSPVSEEDANDPLPARFVVIGGPGQGKSTIGQFLCQLYRASILAETDQIEHAVKDSIRQTVETFRKSPILQNGKLPAVRRFPARIVLSQYASKLANKKELSVLEYLRNEISLLSGEDFSLTDLKEWLSLYPWLLVLDGLDEVPSSSNRSQMLKQIENFCIDLATLNSDVQIVATTRPQNYSDDFNEKHYKHLYLLPLSSEQAMEYGTRLVSVRCGVDERRKETVLRRLQKACETEATARLMKSPLQVTIMATLVERIGEPPQERYRLFEQYYRTIYEREMGREGELSEILSHRKNDIDTIHFRTGLVLQSESEKAGKTDARLSDEKFRLLVANRLAEVGVQGDEVQELIAQLAAGSIERLVFLVRPQVNQVGFEIRSLQEFMAAEAILRDSDVVVIDRLRTIAPISYWRNVFLFAVGKCFSEKEHLLPEINQICRELNDRLTDAISEATYWGSRLALDILAEGVARHHPKFERLLAENALLLTRLPDVDVNYRLGSVYNERLMDLYQKSIRDGLEHMRFVHQYGAWALLSNLADRGVHWACDLANDKWPTRTVEQKRIMLLNRNKPVQAWAISKLTQLISELSPVELSSIGTDEVLTPVADVPQWLTAARAITKRDLTSANRLPVRFHLTEDRTSMLTIHLQPFIGIQGRLEHLRPLCSAPKLGDEWAPYIAAVKFSEHPDAATLAEQLRWLSERYCHQFRGDYQGSLPWPLAACIAAANSSEELDRLAQKAQEGALGNTEAWRIAEQRWLNGRLSVEDVKHMSDAHWPFDSTISAKGFPFAVGLPTIDLYFGTETGGLLEVIDALPGDGYNQIKEWLATAFLMLRTVWHSMAEHTDNKKDRFAIPAKTFKELMLLSQGKTYYPLFLALSTLYLPESIDLEWVELLNWVGETYHERLMPSWRMGTRQLALSRGVTRQIQQIAAWYTAQPEKYPGLLDILATYTIMGSKPVIPDNLLVENQNWNSEKKYANLLLTLAQGNWRIVDSSQIVRKLLSLCKKASLSASLLALNAESVSTERRAAYATSLLEALESLDEDRLSDSIDVLDYLTMIMHSRPSTFGEPSTCARLKLYMASLWSPC